MKVTKEKAAEHRAAIVKAASRLFRERGYDGVGVAEITKAAGLTHGGFYGHFASKEALAAEASGHAFTESAARMKSLDAEGGELALDAYLDRYLSERHRDHRSTGCPMPTLAAEVDRQADALQALFTSRVECFVEALAARLPLELKDPTARRARAMTLMAAMVGSLVLARTTAAASPAFSASLLASVRDELRGYVAR